VLSIGFLCEGGASGVMCFSLLFSRSLLVLFEQGSSGMFAAGGGSGSRVTPKTETAVVGALHRIFV
jgi:hypothetical protein